MTIKSAIGFLSLFIVLQACESKFAELPQGNQAAEATFTSVIDDRVMSRAVNASWEANDVIGLFMLDNADKSVLKTNAAYVTARGDGNFVGKAGNAVYYPEDGTAVDFIAYYPYDEQVEDHTRYVLDVTDQSRQQDIDLMTAVNLTGRTATSPTGNLQFRHLLAKLVLNLSSADGSSLTGIKATVQPLISKATIDLSKESDNIRWDVEEKEKAVSMCVNKECTQADAVLIPQSFEGKLKITLSVNGKDKEIETNIAGNIEAGARYTLNLRISNTGGNTTVDPEAPKYAKWFETPVITKADLERSDLKYITHYMRNGWTDKNGSTSRNFSLFYSQKLKFAYWVAYPLYAKCMGKQKRTDAWRYDDMIDKSWQVNLKSGFGDGYDRGHQLPSGDRTCDKPTNEDTFFFTNVTPQISSMNQEIWARLEGKVRDWSKATDTLFVVTGAVPPKSNIQYKKGMAIPQYYFKALARRISGTYHTIAFAIDNSASVAKGNYMDYAISVSDLEKNTGFEFFPGLDESTKSQLDLSKWQ